MAGTTHAGPQRPPHALAAPAAGESFTDEPRGPLSGTAARPRLQLVGSTRTRRNHGAFAIGGQLACVYSDRRAGICYAVSVEIGADTLQVSGAMTPLQARRMARALIAAADAVAAGGAQ